MREGSRVTGGTAGFSSEWTVMSFSSHKDIGGQVSLRFHMEPPKWFILIIGK